MSIFRASQGELMKAAGAAADQEGLDLHERHFAIGVAIMAGRNRDAMPIEWHKSVLDIANENNDSPTDVSFKGMQVGAYTSQRMLSGQDV